MEDGDEIDAMLHQTGGTARPSRYYWFVLLAVFCLQKALFFFRFVYVAPNTYVFA